MRSDLLKISHLLILMLTISATSAFSKIDSLRIALSQPGLADSTRLAGYLEIAGAYSRENQDSALHFSRLALVLGDQSRIQKWQFNAHEKLGEIYYVNGQYDSSMFYYRQSLELFEMGMDSARYYDVLSGLANNYRQRGDFQEAIARIKACIQYFETTGDERKVAANNNYLGAVFYYLEDLTRATFYWEEALRLYQKIEFKRGISNMLNNLGAIYRKQGQYADALNYYYKSLEMDRKANDLYGQGVMLNNIGYTLNWLGQSSGDFGKHEEALSIYQQAYGINTQISNDYSLIYTLYGLAETHVYLGDYRQSVQYATQGIKLSEQSGSIYELYDLYNVITVAYDSLKDYQKAFMYSEKLRAVQDSIFSDERAQATIEFEEKYKAEQKDNEIELLNKEKKIQTLEIKNKNNLVLGLIMGIMVFIGMGVFLVRLIMMRKQAFDQIAEKNNELADQNEEIAAQRDQIEQQNRNLEEKNNLIVESIRYAQQIQETILPSYSTILTAFDEFFVFYRPKDIVSGDFYWISEKGKLVVAAVDCTGHGIPGAFMSMIGNELLNEIVLDKKITKPSYILEELNKGIIRTLKQNIKHNFHGMDIAICVIDRNRKKLQFAGAKNGLLRMNGGDLHEYKGDRFSLGGLIQKNKEFSTIKIDIEPGDTYYMFSDGLQHQFGGENDKKFSLQRIKHLILDNHHLPLTEQREVFESAFESWKGNEEQIDDVLLLGFKI
jgi:serine phosphatase RsbU (regulator of sigma subunit)/tetratricopeptide (TPR) repeat protein